MKAFGSFVLLLVFSGMAAAQSGLTATLTWQALADSEMIQSYNIYRSSTSATYGSPYGTIPQTAGTQLTFIDANLAPGTYFYIVKAVNIYGQEGPQSNEVKGVIPTTLTAPSVTIGIKVPVAELWIDGTKVASGDTPLNYTLVIPRQTPPQVVTKALQVRVSQ